MKPTTSRILSCLIALIFTSLACNLLSAGPDPTPTPSRGGVQGSEIESNSPATPDLSISGVQQSSGYESEFPLPEDIRDFRKMQEGQINFQTDLSLQEIGEFYRQAFNNQGLRERTLLTLINDAALSMVFEGSANGKLVVVQAVLIDLETRNVNIRYEE